MPKNYLVHDIKPQNLGVSDTQSKNMSTTDTKPRMDLFTGDRGRVYEVTLGAGMYMGLPFLLTYPESITVIQDHD